MCPYAKRNELTIKQQFWNCKVVKLAAKIAPQFFALNRQKYFSNLSGILKLFGEDAENSIDYIKIPKVQC